MLIKKRKGAVLILGVFAAIWMFIVIGILLFDGGIIIAAKMDLYNLADAAASAAVKIGYDEENFMKTGKKQINHQKATDAANKIIELNLRKKWQFKAPVLKFDDTKNSVTVQLTTTVPTFFMKLFGVPEINLKGEAMEGLMQKQ